MKLAKASIGFLGLALVAGCDHNEPSAQSPGAPAAAATAQAVGDTGAVKTLGGPSVGAPPPPGPMTVSDRACGGEYLIDDVEDNNNQVGKQGGRNGYWYTYVDAQGSVIAPQAKTKFLQTPGGSNGSQYAARMSGKMSKDGDPLFAGVGFSFTDPKGAYDATRYTGVSFYAKVGAGSTKTARLKVPDVNTDPVGKVCTECFNDFGADLALTDQWKKYSIPFAAMKQMDGWGAPNPPTIDKSKLYGMQWQVTERGVAYDVWVDDVQFTGCP